MVIYKVFQTLEPYFHMHVFLQYGMYMLLHYSAKINLRNIEVILICAWNNAKYNKKMEKNVQEILGRIFLKAKKTY